MRALGAFVMTTVLFAAAMVIAHGLAIPDPARRFLPTSEQDGAAASEDVDGSDLALDTSGTGTPRTLDEPPVAEVTAIPTPDTATGNSLRDDERASAAGGAEDGGSAPDGAAGGDGPDGSARDGADERTGTSDTPTERRTSKAAPTAPDPAPAPPAPAPPAPSPSPSPVAPSDDVQPQTSSLTAPSSDDDRSWWSNFWWGDDDRDDHRHRDDDRDRHDDDRWRDDDHDDWDGHRH